MADADVADAIRGAVAGSPSVLITTGGTGVNPGDRTPEATLAVLDQELPGVAEAIRTAGRAATPTAALSRGLAGVAGRTVVVNLPGSRGGVDDGLRVLDELLPHLLDQVGGGDHATRRLRPRTTRPATRQRTAARMAEPTLDGPQVLALVTDAPLDRAAIEAFVQSPQDGALVTFEGVIRDHDHGASVSALDYEAHPEAERFLRETCAEVARETGLRVAAAHRIGSPRRRRRRARGIRRRTAPRRGVRGVRAARRPHQGAHPDLEAPAPRRRHDRVGQPLTLPLSPLALRPPTGSAGTRGRRRMTPDRGAASVPAAALGAARAA